MTPSSNSNQLLQSVYVNFFIKDPHALAYCMLILNRRNKFRKFMRHLLRGSAWTIGDMECTRSMLVEMSPPIQWWPSSRHTILKSQPRCKCIKVEGRIRVKSCVSYTHLLMIVVGLNVCLTSTLTSIQFCLQHNLGPMNQQSALKLEEIGRCVHPKGLR